MRKTRSEKIFKIIFTLSVIFFVSSVGMKFYLCNSMTIKNSELEEAFVRKAEVEEDLERLKVQNSDISSITSLEERSKELGFTPMSDRLMSIDLDAPVQVALINSR
ncbi:hypothetical protein K0B04_00080 [Patescibacteria group bacterium]|nr:hypothetical protein [Patescibacteria group bacterium]